MMSRDINADSLLVLILVLQVMVMGLAYWPYLLLRALVVEWAGSSLKGWPAALFVNVLVSMLVVIPLGWVISQFSAPWFNLVVYGGGLAGWIMVLIRNTSERALFRVYYLSHPLPKLQFWMQDLLLSVIYYGLCMAAGTYVLDKDSLVETLEIVVFSLYLAGCQAFAQYSAMDVCRRSAALQRPLARGVFQVGVAVYCTIPALVVAAWIGWRIWQRALWKASLAPTIRKVVK